MLLLSTLIFYCVVCGINASCCSSPITGLQASRENPLVFTAYVRKVQIEQGATTYHLSTPHFYKGSLSVTTFKAILYCPSPVVAQGQVGLFFGSVGHGASATTVRLRPCDPNGLSSDCAIRSLTTGEVCPSTPSDTPSSSTCPQSSCDGHSEGDTWSTGSFGCRTCECQGSFQGGVWSCVSRCETRYTCVIGPSIVGSGIFLFFVCVLILIRRRKKNKKNNNDGIELADVSATQSSTNNYSYQPVYATDPQFGSSVMMTTPQGQSVMVTTQPMVMMTQTGEPVVVQVAYV